MSDGIVQISMGLFRFPWIVQIPMDCSDSYARLFMCPYKKKSRGVETGDLGGQGTGKPHPIHLLGYLSFKSWRAAIEK